MLSSFIFDNIGSDSYGITYALLDTQNINNITFNIREPLAAKSALNDKWVISSNDYKESLSFSINLFNTDGSELSMTKISRLLAWLCKENEYCYFQTRDFHNIWFNVLFYNPEYIIIGGKIAGLSLSAICDASYGYSDEISFQFNIPKGGGNFTLHSNSEKTSFLYPHYCSISLPSSFSYKKITINNDNTQEHRTTELENLFSNEIILLNNESKIITSSQPNKICMGSFNKQWIRLCPGENYFSVNNECIIHMKYREIRKVGVIII